MTIAYKLIEDKTDDQHFAVHIQEGAYTDVVYRYNHVKVTEEDDEYATLKFDWSIIDGDESLQQDGELEHIIGQILEEVLTEAIEFNLSEEEKAK